MEQTKQCNKCGDVKEFGCFNKQKGGKYGLTGRCKPCLKIDYKKWTDINKEHGKNYKKEYYNKNKEIILKKIKESYNKERKSEYNKEYVIKNKDKLIQYAKEYRENNKEKIKESQKEYYKKNKSKNRDKINKYHRYYDAKRRSEDPLYKLKKNLRCRTRLAFKSKSWHKGGSTEKLLGIDYKRCIQHLERQFAKGMNWENQGEWHIDHIIPLASAKTEEELRKLCHYTNLQPLWASDNISKGATIPETQILLRI